MTRRTLSVVFVDDEEMLTELMREHVESQRKAWRIRCFHDEIKALDHIRAHAAAIDVVICDIGMPYISGIEILEIVRKNHRHIRRVVLSGKIDGQSIIGASKFAELAICKPIRIADLCQQVDALVANPAGPP